MSALFSPFSIGELELRNRIVIAPMCQYSAIDGNATDWHLIHLGQMALSGAGLLIIEATAVEPEGRITPSDLGIWSGNNVESINRLLTSIRKYSDMPIAIQLAHAGRKASCKVPWEGGKSLSPGQGGWVTKAPSPIPFAENDRTPNQLNKEGIASIKYAFVEAAKRSYELGFDAIEIHAAHGYLLHQFLSPISNQRDDEYGGTTKNRLRLTLEIFESVRNSVPMNMPVGIRISGTDWVDGGWDIDQSIELALELKKLGCAFIHVSSGGLSPHQTIPLKPNYQVHLANAVRKESGMPTIAVGLITEPLQAEKILLDEQADLVALARGMLYDPRWPWHAAAKLGAKVDAPPQYLRSHPVGLENLFKGK